MQVQSVSQDDKDTLKLAISKALSDRCNCSLSQNNIADEKFSCNNGPNANNVSFYGNLVSIQDVDSVELLRYIQEWLLTEPIVTFDAFSLHAAENCHSYSEEPTNTTYDNCEWLPNALMECHNTSESSGIFSSMGLLVDVIDITLNWS